MQMSLMGCCELAEYECVALKCYLDSGGVKTFGVGSTVSDIPDIVNWSWDTEHTLQEAINIYIRGLTKYSYAVSKAVKVDIKQNEFDALVSFCYNIGVGGFNSSTALRLINQKAPVNDIVASMARWNKDNSKTVQGLINRRAKEAKLYRDAYYGTKGYVNVVPVINKKPVYSQGKSTYLIPYLEKALNIPLISIQGNVVGAPQSIILPQPIQPYTYDLNNLTVDDVKAFMSNLWDQIKEGKL